MEREARERRRQLGKKVESESERSHDDSQSKCDKRWDQHDGATKNFDFQLEREGAVVVVNQE